MRAPTQALVMLLVTALGCAPAPPPGVPEAPPADASLPAGPSLYELTMPLVNQRGEAIAFDVHRGQPVLLAMFYATCPSACPRLMEEVKALEARLPEATRKKTRVLLVSLDPERDTPEILQQAATRHDVDASRWTLARAPDESVRELSAILGVRYRAQMDGTIDHSSAVFLLDPNGVIVEKTDGLGQPTAAIEDQLQEM